MEAFLMNIIDYILNKNFIVIYSFFFVSSFLQITFPPWPGDTLLLFQGYLTTKSTVFSIFPLLVNAGIATSLGSFIFYWLGYKNGELVFKYKLVNKYISQKSRDKAKKIFHKYGSHAIIASKFIPGVNTVIILFAGIFKIKPYIACSSILFSALFHNFIYILLGKMLGQNMTYLKKLITSYNSVIIVLVILSVTGYFIYTKKYSRE